MRLFDVCHKWKRSVIISDTYTICTIYIPYIYHIRVTLWCRGRGYHYCSGYHNCTTSFIKAWTQVLRRFKSCSRRVGDSRWWGSLTMVPAGNKATPFVGQPYRKNNSSLKMNEFLIILCQTKWNIHNTPSTGTT